MNFFSDRDGQIRPATYYISNDAWRGIVAAIEKQIRKDALSKAFPMLCPDGNGICGMDENLFRDNIRAIIPDQTYPWNDIEVNNPFEADQEKIKLQNIKKQYAAIDTIEFVYNHLNDAIKDTKYYHSFFNHFELQFADTSIAKEEFRNDINLIFNRNGIIFSLSNDGQIIRNLPKGIEEQIVIPDIKESTIKDMLSIAVSKFLNPRYEERRIGLEKLWDVFERIKTAYRPDLDKKDSAALLLEAIANGNEVFRKGLDEECKVLTKYGNDFQIRHFEADKIAITSSEILDYFFVRMMSMVQLLLYAFPNN